MIPVLPGCSRSAVRPNKVWWTSTPLARSCELPASFLVDGAKVFFKAELSALQLMQMSAIEDKLKRREAGTPWGERWVGGANSSV